MVERYSFGLTPLTGIYGTFAERYPHPQMSRAYEAKYAAEAAARQRAEDLRDDPDLWDHHLEIDREAD